MTNNSFQSCKIGKLIAVLILSLFIYVPFFSIAQQEAEGKTLILYHSLTDNTKACCEAIQQVLGADIIEIKDLVDRSGRWGFFKSAIGSLLGMHTKIEPETLIFHHTPISLLAHPSGLAH